MVRTCEPFKIQISQLLTRFGLSSVSDLSEHFVELAPPLSLDRFTCPVCLSILVNPVESSCCGNLFCSRCCTSSSCPQCKSSSFKVSANYLVRCMLNNLPVECKYCARHTTRSEFKTHFSQCLFKSNDCKLPDSKRHVAGR
ncbi:hypothetical protein GEMRC1_003284 [Eukaryota sp. GEM-RC1]